MNSDNLNAKDVQDIFKIIQNDSIQEVFKNEELLNVMFNDNNPDQSTMEKLIETPEINSIFHNQPLMSEIVRLQNKLHTHYSKDESAAKLVDLTEDDKKKLDSVHGEFIESLKNMGYREERIYPLVKKHGKNPEKILDELNR
jgi:Holliday junction resolvasome RuvABC DNA-binding subunit